MTGAGIYDGDALIVDRSMEPAHNHIVVAVVDGEFTVKRLYHRSGVVRLMPENPEFERASPSSSYRTMTGRLSHAAMRPRRSASNQPPSPRILIPNFARPI